MALNPISLTEATVTGVTASAALGALVLIRNFARDFLLVWKIRRQLRRTTCGSGIYGVTTSISNRTDREIIVRQVALVTDQEEYIFNATGEVEGLLKREKKLTRDQLKRIKAGEKIEFAAQVRISTKSPPAPLGFVAIQPYTQATFILPAELFAHFNASPQSIRITAEFRLWSGGIHVLQGTNGDKELEMIKKMIGSFRRDLLDGSLNNARKIFGLREISPSVSKNFTT